MSTFGAVGSATTLTRSVVLDGDNWRKGGTAPTAITIGTTPAIPVLLFDATNELLSIQAGLPPDWDKDQDCTCILAFALVETEVNDDVIPITIFLSVTFSTRPSMDA